MTGEDEVSAQTAVGRVGGAGNASASRKESIMAETDEILAQAEDGRVDMKRAALAVVASVALAFGVAVGCTGCGSGSGGDSSGSTAEEEASEDAAEEGEGESQEGADADADADSNADGDAGDEEDSEKTAEEGLYGDTLVLNTSDDWEFSSSEELDDVLLDEKSGGETITYTAVERGECDDGKTYILVDIDNETDFAISDESWSITVGGEEADFEVYFLYDTGQKLIEFQDIDSVDSLEDVEGTLKVTLLDDNDEDDATVAVSGKFAIE